MSWRNGLGECHTRTAHHEAGHVVTAYCTGPLPPRWLNELENAA